MVKVDPSNSSCQLSIPDNLETDLILLYGLKELMKIQYTNNHDGTWTIKSLDNEDNYIGDVSAKPYKVGNTLRLVEDDNQDDSQDDHLHLLHDIYDCNGSTKIHLVDPVTSMMSSHKLFALNSLNPNHKATITFYGPGKRAQDHLRSMENDEDSPYYGQQVLLKQVGNTFAQSINQDNQMKNPNSCFGQLGGFGKAHNEIEWEEIYQPLKNAKSKYPELEDKLLDEDDKKWDAYLTRCLATDLASEGFFIAAVHIPGKDNIDKYYGKCYTIADKKNPINFIILDNCAVCKTRLCQDKNAKGIDIVNVDLMDYLILEYEDMQTYNMFVDDDQPPNNTKMFKHLNHLTNKERYYNMVYPKGAGPTSPWNTDYADDFKPNHEYDNILRNIIKDDTCTTKPACKESDDCKGKPIEKGQIKEITETKIKEPVYKIIRDKYANGINPIDDEDNTAEYYKYFNYVSVALRDQINRELQ